MWGMTNSFRETPDIADATSRLVRAIGRRVGQEDATSLESLVIVERALGDAWRDAVTELRRAGTSDREIGEALGVTQQAVNKRWPRRPS